MSVRHIAPYLALALTLALMPNLASAQDVAAGDRLFRQRCSACHTIQSGQNRIGPHLAGIIGRKAGSVEGARYSKGMQEFGVTWDAAQLSTFMSNPRAMVPGTTMTVAVPNEVDRTSIVSYLQGLTTSN